jgi:lycopene cyclase domain-containing protein
VSYSVAAVVGVLAALAVDLLIARTRLVLRRLWWVSYAIILFFQLVANGVLTGRGIVRYDESAITGLRIGYAPVEDLLFGFAMVLLTLSLWVWLGRRGVQYRPVSGESRPRHDSPDQSR